MSRLAVVLFNLGGPDSPEAVKPFLRNLFGDPAILPAPAPIRFFLLGTIYVHKMGGLGPTSQVRLPSQSRIRLLGDAPAGQRRQGHGAEQSTNSGDDPSLEHAELPSRVTSRPTCLR